MITGRCARKEHGKCTKKKCKCECHGWNKKKEVTK